MIVKLGKLLVLAQCRQHARAAIGRNELEQGRPRLEGKDARCGSTGMLVNGKRDFLRTMTLALLTDGLRIEGGI
ncbi:hypothetical protein IVB52_15000 [Bradyrhizobium sp. CW11]|nr:hypothetical protein [Bradyrhizobium sp. CW11]